MEVKRVEHPINSKNGGVWNSYEGDRGAQEFKVTFKWGCADIHKVDPLLGDDQYLHICDPREFITFLQDAMKLSGEEGNSWEQG